MSKRVQDAQERTPQDIQPARISLHDFADIEWPAGHNVVRYERAGTVLADHGCPAVVDCVGLDQMGIRSLHLRGYPPLAKGRVLDPLVRLFIDLGEGWRAVPLAGRVVGPWRGGRGTGRRTGLVRGTAGAAGGLAPRHRPPGTFRGRRWTHPFRGAAVRDNQRTRHARSDREHRLRCDLCARTPGRHASHASVGAQCQWIQDGTIVEQSPPARSTRALFRGKP